MSSQEFQAQAQAEAAFAADAMSLEKLAALETAEAAYLAAYQTAKAAWDAVEEGQAKDSAELNAWDTVAEQAANPADQVQWLRWAVGSLDR